MITRGFEHLKLPLILNKFKFKCTCKSKVCHISYTHAELKFKTTLSWFKRTKNRLVKTDRMTHSSKNHARGSVVTWGTSWPPEPQKKTGRTGVLLLQYWDKKRHKSNVILLPSSPIVLLQLQNFYSCYCVALRLQMYIPALPSRFQLLLRHGRHLWWAQLLKYTRL